MNYLQSTMMGFVLIFALAGFHLWRNYIYLLNANGVRVFKNFSLALYIFKGNLKVLTSEFLALFESKIKVSSVINILIHIIVLGNITFLIVTGLKSELDLKKIITEIVIPLTILLRLKNLFFERGQFVRKLHEELYRITLMILILCISKVTDHLLVMSTIGVYCYIDFSERDIKNQNSFLQTLSTAVTYSVVAALSVMYLQMKFLMNAPLALFLHFLLIILLSTVTYIVKNFGYFVSLPRKVFRLLNFLVFLSFVEGIYMVIRG